MKVIALWRLDDNDYDLLLDSLHISEDSIKNYLKQRENDCVVDIDNGDCFVSFSNNGKKYTTRYEFWEMDIKDVK